MEHKKELSDAEFYAALVEQVRRGDWEQGVELLKEFSRPAPHPVIVGYVAECVRSWLAFDPPCDPRKAAEAFNVKRARGESASPRRELEDIRAVYIYLLCRGRRWKNKAATIQAATKTHLSPKRVGALIVGLRENGLTEAQAAAVLSIGKKSMRTPKQSLPGFLNVRQKLLSEPKVQTLTDLLRLRCRERAAQGKRPRAKRSTKRRISSNRD